MIRIERDMRPHVLASLRRTRDGVASAPTREHRFADIYCFQKGLTYDGKLTGPGAKWLEQAESRSRKRRATLTTKVAELSAELAQSLAMDGE